MALTIARQHPRPGGRLRRARGCRRWPGLVCTVLLVSVAAACAQPASYDTLPDLVDDYFGGGQSLRSGGDFGFDRIHVTESEDTPFATALEVEFPKGSASPEVHRETGAPEGGAQFYTTLNSGPVESATLDYQVRFPAGFDFVKGGKLPGLFGGTATAGGRLPDGTDGFSTRYMWREGGAGEVYAYLPTSEDGVGTSLGRGDWSWPTGRWIKVEQEVVLNTPGEEDGGLTVRLDGEQVYENHELEFRQVPDVNIEGVFFSTFFGGGDPSWSTPVDQSIQFADFRLRGTGAATEAG